MKKIKYLLILFLILIPFKINAAAASITSVRIDGNDTIEVGSDLLQSFAVQFSNIKKGTSDTLGIWLVAYELEYDEKILVIEETYSSGNVWASTVYKENGKTYVISQFNKDPYKNACVDGVLYCADYIISIKFYVKDTNKKSTVIKMKDIGAGAFQVSGNINPEYNTSDMIELEYSSELSKTINITSSENVDVKVPKSIVTSKPKTNTTVKSTNTTTNNKTTEKSNNNYLKQLKISGYPINFSKDTIIYDINVPTNVNALKIGATTENDKATIEIIGADDLEKNNGQVLINVKAENGDIKSYTINVTKKDNIKEEKASFKLTKKHMIIGGIIIGSIFLILIIIGLIIHFKDRKIDKAIDSM